MDGHSTEARIAGVLIGLENRDDLLGRGSSNLSASASFRRSGDLPVATFFQIS